MTDVLMLIGACGILLAVLCILAAFADALDPMGDQRRESQRRNGRG